MQRRYLTLQYDEQTMVQMAAALEQFRINYKRYDCYEVTPGFKWAERYFKSLAKYYVADRRDDFSLKHPKQDTHPVMALTLEQTAQRAGVSLRTVKRHVQSGDLKVWRKGRVVRVTLEAFNDWLYDTGREPVQTDTVHLVSMGDQTAMHITPDETG